MSSLKVIKPIPITGSMIISTDVSEADYPVYSASVTYALADRVMLNHVIYESLQASNTGHAPATESAWWIEVSPTNRWKLFDTSNTTQTSKANSMSYTIAPGTAVTSVGMLNLTGAISARIRQIDPQYGTVYDRTFDLSSIPFESSWWAWVFGERLVRRQQVAFGLQAYPNAEITIDLTGGADLAIGVLALGYAQEIGLGVTTGAKLGIQDYSRKEKNDFGDTVLVERAFAKRAMFDLLIENRKIDSVQDMLTELRAKNCLWIGSQKYGSSMVYGFIKQFDIVISYNAHSDCQLEIEGLT